MKGFIARKMRDVFQDFQHGLSSMDRFCELKNIRFDGGNIPDYENIHIQQLYLLRYFPAYLVEYYLIYKKLLSYNFLTDYKVFSLGCGANIDFYGLYYALIHHGTFDQATTYSYKGLDKTDWCYKEDLGVHNYSYINTDINQWQSLDASDYNVIIFPKSIGEFSNKVFRHIQTMLLNTTFTENNLVLISSTRLQHSPIDMHRFEIITNLLTNNFGFNNLDNNITCFRLRDSGSGIGLSRCCNDFYYPDHVKSFIESLLDKCPVYQDQEGPCEEDCTEIINRNPILTARYIQFQINRFTREQ